MASLPRSIVLGPTIGSPSRGRGGMGAASSAASASGQTEAEVSAPPARAPDSCSFTHCFRGVGLSCVPSIALWMMRVWFSPTCTQESSSGMRRADHASEASPRRHQVLCPCMRWERRALRQPHAVERENGRTVQRSMLNTLSSAPHDARPKRSRTPPSTCRRPSDSHTGCMMNGTAQLAATICEGREKDSGPDNNPSRLW